VQFAAALSGRTNLCELGGGPQARLVVTWCPKMCSAFCSSRNDITAGSKIFNMSNYISKLLLGCILI